MHHFSLEFTHSQIFLRSFKNICYQHLLRFLFGKMFSMTRRHLMDQLNYINQAWKENAACSLKLGETWCRHSTSFWDAWFNFKSLQMKFLHAKNVQDIRIIPDFQQIDCSSWISLSKSTNMFFKFLLNTCCQ